MIEWYHQLIVMGVIIIMKKKIIKKEKTKRNWEGNIFEKRRKYVHKA